MARSVLDINLENQKKILALKEQYRRATTDAERQKASQQADAIRASLGVQAGSGGEFTEDQLRKIVSSGEQRNQDLQRQQAQQRQQDMQNELFRQRERSKIAELSKARDTSLSALEQEKRAIEPAYAGARSNVRATSRRGARSFSEYLAQRGLTRSGGSALGETQRLGAMQGALGGLQKQETSALGDIARRKSDIQRGYASDVESARSGIEGDRLQFALNQQQSQAQSQAQQQQQTFENALRLAGVTGEYGGRQTLDAQQQQFNQQAKLAEFNEKIRQFDATLDQKTRQFEADYAMDTRKQTFNESQKQVENAIRRGQLSVSQGNALLAKHKFEAEQDPDSLDNQLKQQRLNEKVETAADTKTTPIKSTSYKTNPDFANDYARVVSASADDRSRLLATMQQNAEAFIAKYGLDGYKELLNQLMSY